jgi:hypothetical protein
VLVNDEPFVEAASAAGAGELAALLRRLVDAEPRDRESVIETALRTAADRDRIRARLDRFRGQSRALAGLGVVLFGYLFVLAPGVVFLRGLGPSWKTLLLGFAGIWVLTVTEYLRAHRALYPKSAAERRGRFVMMALAPTGAIRALDYLGENLLVGFDPAAVASVVLDDVRFRVLARRIARDLRNPARPIAPEAQERAVRTESWFRTHLTRVFDEVLASAGEEPGVLLRPPVPAEVGCRSFCPRCEEQYVMASGECDDCGGIPLVPFEGVPA